MTDYSMGGNSSASSGPKNIKNGTVSDIKASPERGKKRIIVREKSARAQSFAVDIPMREARNVERKESYSFDVKEKPIKPYGSDKKTGFKSYYCDEAPEKYGGGGGQQFKSFSDGNRLGSSDRTKF